MITTLLNPTTATDPALAGIKRARFSLHFNTARTRRWLLVQLVTAPQFEQEEDKMARTTTTAAPRRKHEARTPTLGRLLDDYNSSRIGRHCI